MTNDEIRRNDEILMPKRDPLNSELFDIRDSDFFSTFDIRHSDLGTAVHGKSLFVFAHALAHEHTPNPSQEGNGQHAEKRSPLGSGRGLVRFMEQVPRVARRSLHRHQAVLAKAGR